MVCQVDTIIFSRENHPLRKPPHAFGSDLVVKSETEMARRKLLNIMRVASSSSSSY